MLHCVFTRRPNIQLRPWVVRGCAVFCAILLFSIAVNIAAVAEAGPSIDYSRDIRPILSDRCFRCHGPDAGSRKADLRLDVRESVIEQVVVPGKPDESELIRRVFSEDAEERMPPPDSHLTLTTAEKELLRRWIAEGAVFAEHWAFRPLPDQVDVPSVTDETWPRAELDHFVLARLELEGLKPSPEAKPLRLLRRMTLDLTGLPPTAEEIHDFETQAAADPNAALAQAVDRLLTSSAYGEHMAVGWLDAARYADSFGYQSDHLNTQWPYRDWVIRAFNQNLPYDQFITWQLAGDLQPNPSRDQILATAFNRMHRLTNEGGSLSAEHLVENASDRVHTFGTAILGLTVECARCHDHKYDPISTRDYYSLTAFFNSIDENGLYDHPAKVPSPSLLLPTPEQEAGLAAARKEVTDAESAFAVAIKEGEPRFQSWLKQEKTGADIAAAADKDLVAHYSFDEEGDQVPNHAPNSKVVGSAARIERIEGIHGRAVRFDGDRGVEFPGLMQIDRWDPFTLDLWVRDAARNPQPVVLLQRCFGTDVGFNGFDVMLQDGFLEARMYRVWPGNAIGVRSLEQLAKEQWQHVAVAYDGSSSAHGLQLYLNGKKLPTVILRDRIQKSACSHIFSDGRWILGQRFRDRGFKDGEIDEFRVFERALTPLEIENLHEGQSLAIAFREPQVNQNSLREFYFSAVDPESRARIAELREARQRFVAEEDKMQEVSVMQELDQPRTTYVLPRGAYDAPQTDANRVGRDTFRSFLPPFPVDGPRNRLGLAQWLTEPHHPLTARVFVNRLWAKFFGRGLVSTPENFGLQGTTPTHPELLDWLARDFINHGWDIKRLCRQIVLSATYRQDSRVPPELRGRDPENHLLARGPSRRLSAEQIRDLALAASDLLERRLGGPPVSPYQPGGDLWRESNSMSPAYQQSTGKDLHRRSIYSVWKRTAPLPNMMAFDANAREVCVVSRARTNTPLQALVLLNDVQFVEAARALATAVSSTHASARDQIGEAFLRLTGRPPDAVELELLTGIYDEQKGLFADKNEQDAAKFTAEGEAKPDTKLPPADLAALTVTCQAIFNLDATVYER